MDSDKRKQLMAIKMGEWCERAGKCPTALKWLILALVAAGNWISLLFLGFAIHE